MAAVSLFWNTNMAALTSRENAFKIGVMVTPYIIISATNSDEG